MNRELLCAPFPKELVRSRPGKNGKQLSYIPTHAVIARLNEGCEAWDFTIESHNEFEGTEVIVLGRLVVDGVTKSAFGGSSVTKDRDGNIISLADDLKAAASDSLKKCASLLGVGLELYGGPVQHGSTVSPGGNRSGPNVAPARPAPAPANESRPSSGATVRQLTAIHAASRRRGLDQRALDELVVSTAGKRDISHLTKSEASALIDNLNATSAA